MIDQIDPFKFIWKGVKYQITFNLSLLEFSKKYEDVTVAMTEYI